VETPVVATDYANDFYGNCDNMMLYYTGGRPNALLSNRTLTSSPQKTRILGVQLYKYRAKGFLHWGYNYYYGRLAHGLYDPAIDPCCGFPNAGTTYSVYPGKDRKPMQSIHQKIFADGLVDMRALQLLESLVGREVCEKLIDGMLGSPNFFNTPETPEKLMEFRNAVNNEIKKYI
jgi:hypothetical protein